MRMLLATTMLSCLLAFPALAQMSSDDVSCAHFLAMDSSGQMEALGAMGSGMTSGMMQSEAGMQPEDSMSSGDSMKSEDSMKSGEMASGKAVSTEEVAKACTDHPDMMVHDAVDQAMMVH